MKRNIKDLSLPSLIDTIIELTLKPYTAKQVIQWLYQKGVGSFDEMTNISNEAKKVLSEQFIIKSLDLSDKMVSSDGTMKLCWKLVDGEYIESVLIPTESGRTTICISTQVGCAMGCKFCRTADMGFIRNLTQSEILDQVLESQRILGPGNRITNIVLMGMGEPLNNYDNVLSAIAILADETAVAVGKRKITLSTSGLVDMIDKLAIDDPKVKLAISLNATDDEMRSELMPVNKKWKIRELLRSCKKYIKNTRRHRITIEYVMFGELNDKPANALKLVQLLSDVPSKVNLIPFNPFEGSPYKAPTDAAVKAFQDIVREKGIQVNVRKSRGRDILAACGQLAGEKKK